MKNIGKWFVGMLVVASAMCWGTTSYAGYWDWSQPYTAPSKNIETLVITANYVRPRMLADLIQREIKQPYILLPARGDTKIFFCPARGKQSLEIAELELSKFIKFLNPRQIIVLGDTRYVSDKFIRMIDPRQTVWIVSNTNWQLASESIAKFLDIPNISYDFKMLCTQYDSGVLYKTEEKDTTDFGKPARLPEAAPAAMTPAEPPAATEEAAAPVAAAPGGVRSIEEAPGMKEPEVVVPAEPPVLIKDKAAAPAKKASPAAKK